MKSYSHNLEIAKRHKHFRCPTEGARHPDLEWVSLADEDPSKAAGINWSFSSIKIFHDYVIIITLDFQKIANEGPNSGVASMEIEDQQKPNPVGSTAGRILCNISPFFFFMFLGILQMFPLNLL